MVAERDGKEVVEANCLPETYLEDPLGSQVGQWANNLIVTPFVEDMPPTLGSSKAALKSTLNNSHMDKLKKLPIRKPITRSLAKTPPRAAATTTATSPYSSLSNTIITSPCSPTESSHVPPPQVDLSQDHVSLMRTELKGLEELDVFELCQPHVEECDIFDSDQENYVRSISSVSDEEDSDFDESDNSTSSDGDESLDDEEEMEDFDALDDIDIENDTEMRLRLESCNGDDDTVAVKMGKAYSQGRLWSAGRDGTITLRVRDMFTNKQELLRVMKDYCVERGMQLKKIKNNATRYSMRCVNRKCPWKMHASRMLDKNTFVIRSFLEGYKCPKYQRNKNAGSRWVASKLLDEFRDNRNMDTKTMQNRMMTRYGIDVPNYTCTRARRIMREVVEGKHDEGYKLLPQYMEVFKEHNPESIIFILWQGEGVGKNPTFKRCQICLGSSIAAFKSHCRPLIGIDACHLKSPYKGVLITAMGLDGNNGQFPLAYGVAPKEDEEEWTQFLDGLAIALDAREDSSRYTIMSDRHRGIVAALKRVMPRASRRICVLHFYKNFASLFPGPWFHAFFYVAANAYNEYVFKKAMDKIKEKDVEAYNWLRTNEPLEHWARFKFDELLNVDDNTNNFVESFNNAINKHRMKPVLTMLEEIRKIIGSRFEKRLTKAADWDTKVTPFVMKKLKNIEAESRNCVNLVPAGREKFELTEGHTKFTVKLGQRHCDCRKWQISGLPCKHAAQCILHLNRNLEDYCADWFLVDRYRMLYDNIIHPIPDPCFWPETTLPSLDPPFKLKKKGRPEKHKRKESRVIAEGGPMQGTKRCKTCGNLGHNKTTCGRPRDVNGKLIAKYKKKRKSKTGKPVGRPPKKPRIGQETNYAVPSQGSNNPWPATQGSQAPC